MGALAVHPSAHTNSHTTSGMSAHETKTVTPIFFFAFLAQVTHYLTAVKILKKFYRVENFLTNVLKKRN